MFKSSKSLLRFRNYLNWSSLQIKVKLYITYSQHHMIDSNIKNNIKGDYWMKSRLKSRWTNSKLCTYISSVHLISALKTIPHFFFLELVLLSVSSFIQQVSSGDLHIIFWDLSKVTVFQLCLKYHSML